MKKILSVIFVILIVSLFSASVVGAASADYVYDNANLLSAEEISALEEKCKAIHDEKNYDVVIVTTKSFGGKSDVAYADDFYDNGGFLPNGVLLLVGIESRRVYISTAGTAIQRFGDDTIEGLLDIITPEIKNVEYAKAFNDFVDQTERVMAGKGLGKTTSQIVIRVAIAIFAALIISYIIVNGMKKKLNTAVKQRGAAKYIKGDTAKVTVARDLFMYSTTTRVRRETSSSSGGSSHTSSGGVSHGGGGRSF